MVKKGKRATPILSFESHEKIEKYTSFQPALLLSSAVGAARWEDAGEISGCFSRGLSGLKCKLICNFKFTVDMVSSGIRQSVYDMDGSAILKKKLY